ncbi:MAG: phosphatidylserine decarboxylase [Deltaproteobacteria bacterium]|nr:phosphatidylserine decarboxylase [Deltaproteobacteria bacterium]
MKGIHYIDRKTGNIRQEIVPGERWLKWLYCNPFGKLALEGLVKRKFLSQWYGRKMDKPASKNKIPGFIKELNIDMGEVLRPANDFSTLNDFFIRRLKPESRPIERDVNAIVSPADGKTLGFTEIDSLDTFFVKGHQFSIEKLLQDQSLSKRYAGGTLLIFRLAPADYHRFHFPANGRISKSTRINGAYYSVSPYAVKKRMKIYWENTREYSILTTLNAGDILLCEIGATMVGSIVQNYLPDTEVIKGDEKGWFSFGGSTVIVLFEKNRVKIDTDIIENTRKGYETSIRVGEKLATLLLR